jgi:hypothetical protein
MTLIDPLLTRRTVGARRALDRRDSRSPDGETRCPGHRKIRVGVVVS